MIGMMRMINLIKKLHLYGIWRKTCLFFINYIFTGMRPLSFDIKRYLFRLIGFPAGKGTALVGDIKILGSVEIGKDCWINRGFTVHGNGHVKIGDCCDIAPDVTFLTGGHQIGSAERRAGKGETYVILVEDGCWIGAGTTIARNVTIGHSAVVAACACVVQDVPPNTLVGGVPAKVIRSLRDAENKKFAEEQGDT